ncbi:MAG: serine/threonine protein kinase [Kofleriaceae bacterium]
MGDTESDVVERGDATEEVDTRIGQLVDDRYKILESMASGSMGAVYKAERVPVGKLVALKFLHASFAKDSEFQTRFERETRVMSKLSHPNCVSVVDFGVWQGAPYLAMEYVTGTTLRALIDKGPIPVGRALVLARQIAAGLAHAHAQGVVHRDVKPANIMISDEVGTGDHVRILDFGLARLRGNVGRDATQTNVVVGTPNYMAPEQTIGGGTIDARTDIYACGVVLFEMISGERPFNAKDTMALLGMHRAAPTPKLKDRMNLMAGSTEIPEGVQELVEKAMAKSPDERFQSAVALADAIEELVGSRTSSEHKVPVIPMKRAQTDPAIVTPSMIESESGRVATTIKKERTEPVRQRSGGGGGFLFVLLLLGGAAAAFYVIALRAPDKPAKNPNDTALPPITTDASATGSSGSGEPGSAAIAAVMPDASEATINLDAAELVVDAGEAMVVWPDAVDEIEMDPLTADNPDPHAGSNTAEDQAPDAPDTIDENKVEEPPPERAKNVTEAIQMLKDGKRELARQSLHALWKKSPNSAQIPFLLGNIYNDKLWWSVAMDHYKIAISKNGGYKANAILNRNVIDMLASPKTVRKAQAFIRSTIGRSAKGYLANAAKYHRNSNVKKQAAALLKQIR